MGGDRPKTISPAGFTDLPSPLPGFVFRDNSFPMIAFGGNKPRVVWSSYDTGAGRTYLYSGGHVSIVSNTGGDQFFPAVAIDTNGKLAVSWSQTDETGRPSYDRYLSYLGAVTKISTASSFPNNDPIFGGAFIGDYEAMVAGLHRPSHLDGPPGTELRAERDGVLAVASARFAGTNEGPPRKGRPLGLTVCPGLA